MSGRVTVTGPSRRSWTDRHRPAGDTAAPGAEHVRALMRVQAALALRTCGIVASVAGGLPLLFACEPGLSRIRLCGVRLPWLVLCAVVPLIWIATARRHVHLAERAEHAFVVREFAAREAAAGAAAARDARPSATGRGAAA